MTRKVTTPLLVLFFLFSCFKNSEGLKKSEVPSLVNQFLSSHVEYRNLNDEISERTLNNFIYMLDYGKYYFYKEDIDRFMKYRHSIDDMIASGNFAFVDDIWGVYKKRFKETMDTVPGLIKQKHDFNKDEQIVVDREKVEYARTKEEMRERWRKNIKLQLLNYLSSDKNMNDARDKLQKKFRILTKKIEGEGEDEIMAQFMNAFTMALDPHSNYLTQDEHEDFLISMKLKLEGIGVRLRSEDGFVFVESIITGGAADRLAQKLKLKPNDKIIAVAQGKGEFEDVVDMDLRDVVKKIRGKKGTEVRLTILRENPDTHRTDRLIVPIIREEISLKDSAAEYSIHLQNNDASKKYGYIRLPSFYFDRDSGKSSSGDMKKILAKMNEEKVKAVVLDLRGNPGGLLNEAIDIAGFFIEGGPVLQVKDSTNPPQVYFDQDSEILWKGPLVVLIDRFSASAAEILAGAIKDYKRGLIVGPTNTFGKGTVQTYNELPFKRGAIKITISIFYQPGGTSNQLNGIAPDIVIPDMSAIWDLGEEKMRYPLKWKKIPSAEFKPFGLVNPGMVDGLSSASKGRIRSNTEFSTLIEKIEKFKKQLRSKTISLKEESGAQRQQKKEIEKTLQREDRRKIMDLKNDLLLREALNITGDYLNLLGR